jgi:hypothetical protein
MPTPETKWKRQSLIFYKKKLNSFKVATTFSNGKKRKKDSE